MSTFAGMRVHVSRPTRLTVRRTWRERLFTKPWRPFRVTEERTQSALIAPDECYRIDDQLFCGERFYLKLCAATLQERSEAQP